MSIVETRVSDEKAGHTPGPWAVHPRRAVIVPCAHLGRPLGAHEDPAVDAERYAQEICSLHWPDRNRKEQEVRANARLISAAPDMLAALKRALPFIVANGYAPDDQPLCDTIAAAISEAEGKPQGAG